MNGSAPVANSLGILFSNQHPIEHAAGRQVASGEIEVLAA